MMAASVDLQETPSIRHATAGPTWRHVHFWTAPEGQVLGLRAVLFWDLKHSMAAEWTVIASGANICVDIIIDKRAYKFMLNIFVR